MRKSPQDISTQELFETAQSRRYHLTQHGTTHGSLSLLSLPSESLTHITSFLDPISLLFLGRTSKRFYDHVKDDNTWHRAFVCQVLDIGPEKDLHGLRSLTLRRSESSWKKEFISRYNLRRRWLRSRTPTITHVPHYASISRIHVLPDDALLSSSIQYGIVARSFPFTGKIMKGYLDTTGMRHGLGLGNPNAEFTPDVTVCVLASEGSTANIIWGRRDGSVSVMFHPRTMSGTRATARLHTSTVEDEHVGAVQDAVWVGDGAACLTAGADGRIKIWSTRRFGCVWTSERVTGQPVDPCLKVVESLSNGMLVAGTKRGSLLIYHGFDFSVLHTPGASQGTVHSLTITPPPFPSGSVDTGNRGVTTLYLDVRSPTSASILVGYEDDPLFYRYTVDLEASRVAVTAFGDPAAGVNNCMQPAFSFDADETGYIVAGDQLGSISIYDWEATPLTDHPVPPTRRVDVFADAAIAAVAVNTSVIAVGSSRGTIRVVDAVTFDALRSFAAPVHNSVSQIVLKRDTLIGSVGSRVIAWKAGAVDSKGGYPYKTKGKAKTEGDRKWRKQIEFMRDIEESRDDTKKEAQFIRQAFGREREQLSQLEALGLSEREAVEYVLMLSRDEEGRNHEGQSSDTPFGRPEEEGVFDVDVDEGNTSSSSRTYASLSPSPPSLSPPSRPSTSPPVSVAGSYPRSWASVSPPTSHIKVQVSPRFYPEPIQAGGLSTSPLNLDAVRPVAIERDGPQFPPIVSSGSVTPLWKASSSQSSGGGSPGSRNAWKAPLRTPPSTSPPALRSSGASSRATIPQYRSETTSDSHRAGADWEREAVQISEVEDEDLRFALELSLAEAKSREEKVFGF
ncbi:hypothetical protein BV25DRAFT_987335 [Artomyces pyxidatus]|uniref:Uncharacterized protein n=1 Tax=Artomyces pyxidatus TaxID=48021 RepID=A0ACB8SVE1_9AGAM|nr:hypothetical protein BV25DRAFT_987335 [Artomyces pyxidatus]